MHSVTIYLQHKHPFLHCVDSCVFDSSNRPVVLVLMRFLVQLYLTLSTGHAVLKSWLHRGWLFLLPAIHHCILSPFTLCNEQSCLLHICWKQSFSMMHPSHSLPLSVTLSCTHKTQDQTTLATHIHLSILLYRNGLGQLSQPPLCFTVVVTLLLVSPQWSAGYSLNLWLLHNL